jgi:hypothetical protein
MVLEIVLLQEKHILIMNIIIEIAFVYAHENRIGTSHHLKLVRIWSKLECGTTCTRDMCGIAYQPLSPTTIPRWHGVPLLVLTNDL